MHIKIGTKNFSVLFATSLRHVVVDNAVSWDHNDSGGSNEFSKEFRDEIFCQKNIIYAILIRIDVIEWWRASMNHPLAEFSVS